MRGGLTQELGWNVIDEANRGFDELAEVLGSRRSREDICCCGLAVSIVESRELPVIYCSLTIDWSARSLTFLSCRWHRLYFLRKEQGGTIFEPCVPPRESFFMNIS